MIKHRINQSESNQNSHIMDDETIISQKVMDLMDSRHTGAVPKSAGWSSNYLPSFYWDTVEKINQGQRVCIILRGAPGSGKSSLGQKIIEDTIKTNAEEHIISADDYFMRNGRYTYDGTKISEAHQYAQRTFMQRASKGYSPLIVDNTNMKYWELVPYIQVAIQYQFHVEIMEPQTPWKFKARDLAQKNKHGVPMDKIKKMMENYDTIMSVKEFAKNVLNLDVVTQPKLRDIPPYFPKPSNKIQVTKEYDLLDFTFDENKNTSNKTIVNDKAQAPLTWQKFNTEFQFQTGTNPFSRASNNVPSTSNWDPPPQIFEEKWDQPTPKEITIREKAEEEEIKPQPQRKQRKNKKPSTPPENDLKPHRKNCFNENPNFVQLRELYPHIRDNFLWDFFEKCKGDLEWCADMLCDDNLTEQMMDTGDELTCSCSSSDSESSIPPPKYTSISSSGSHVKKQTPVKAKKAKSNADEVLAVKMAIEENIRIGAEFYPEHVQQVKVWKGISSQVPEQQSVATNSTIDEDSTLVAVSIEESLIRELSDIFGGDKEVMNELLEQQNRSTMKMFIKSSTAKKLYQEILETLYSHQEEAKLQATQNDREFALILHQEDKARKYPNLVREPVGNSFKEIMDTQAALKEYEEDMGGWQKVEKPETIAVKLNKEKLYRVFATIDREMIDQIYEAQNRNFKKTVELIEDNLGFSEQQRKEVEKAFENALKFSTEQPDDEFTDEEYSTIKRVEDLQQEFDRHSETIERCVQKSRYHIERKEFEVAGYFSSMANLHKQMCEEVRQQLMNILAYSFLNDSSSKRLDLHYFTQEAGKTRLHTFLDAHIAKLREMKKQFMELEIVTGRGAHSSNGPVLKNMTIRLFQERGLRYSELNPGMLKVKVFMNSKLYDEIQKIKSDN